MHQTKIKNHFQNRASCGRSLIIVGHGSTTNPDSSEPTHLHADRIRSMKIFDEVRCAFWKEEPSLREVLHGITSPEIIIVPNFISEGYFTQKVIPRELALEGKITQRGQQTIYYCDPVGSHPSMTAVILKRAHETAPEIDPAQTTLFIVGHGTQLNENSAKAAKDQVAKIRLLSKLAYADEVQGVDGAEKLSVQKLLDASEVNISSPPLRDAVETDEARRMKNFDAGLYASYCPSQNSNLTQHSSSLPQVVVDGDETIHSNTGATKQFAAEVECGEKSASMNLYGEVLSAYMEETPLISDWHTMATKEHVVVVPFFISDGLHSYQDIPLLLGIEKEIGPAASQAEVFRRNPYHLHGKTLYYASAIGTEPMIAEVILEQARLLS